MAILFSLSFHASAKLWQLHSSIVFEWLSHDSAESWLLLLHYIHLLNHDCFMGMLNQGNLCIQNHDHLCQLNHGCFMGMLIHGYYVYMHLLNHGYYHASAKSWL